jgi:uncharacterized repeat protein (TIGR03803 family)
MAEGVHRMKTKCGIKNRWSAPFKAHVPICLGMLLLCTGARNSSAQTYTVLHNFIGIDGKTSFAALVSSGTALFGTTSIGGSNGDGTVFRVNEDGSGFTVLKDFGAGNEGFLRTGLALSGTSLFGASQGSDSSYPGMIYTMNTDGSGFTALKQFTGGDGAWPGQGKLLLQGPTLYGTTSGGGISWWTNSPFKTCGTVFKMNSDGSGFVTLKCFSGSDGSLPNESLILSGTTLYGTTQFGGSNYNYAYAASGYGTLFKINTDGSSFSVLKLFAGGVDGVQPNAGLVLSGATLYGTTEYGGISNSGTIFKINTDGTGFAILKQFTGWGTYGVTNGDGAYPGAGLVLSDTNLYGTTISGGIYGIQGGGSQGYGTIFRLNLDGTGYTVLKRFTFADGENPYAELTLSSNLLYGTTGYGGSSALSDGWGCGTVFRLSLPFGARILESPQTQTAEAGSAAYFAVMAVGDPQPVCQWFFNSSPIAGCTNQILCLSCVEATNVGAYSVVVTNSIGAQTSAPAMLNVISPVEHKPAAAISLMGDVGASLNIQYSDSPGPQANWLPLDTVNLTNPPQYYFDVSTPLPPQRFYRAWQMGTPVVPPSLAPPLMVPAITLSGNIGDTLELDYINQIGPTNAWVPLGTVTLSNTSQLYFDMTAPRQAARLYRIVPVP